MQNKRITLKLLSILFLSMLIQSSVLGQNKESLKIASIPHTLFWDIKPQKYSIKNNELVIIAGPKTDMFRDPNVTYNTDNAPKLLFEADVDFVLSASVEHSFASKWDGGAIVLKQDSLNWIKFCFEKDYTGARRVISVVTKNISDDCNSVEINANKVFYKVAKAGNVITLYYSPDTKKWFLIRHFQFDTAQALHVGFMAQSPTGPGCEVKFSDIRYEARKINDPYLGE